MQALFVALRGRIPQWRINAMQFDWIDLHVAVFVTAGGNLPGLDGPQDCSLVPSDRRGGHSDGVHEEVPVVPVSDYGATTLVKKR
jgi:hypothetical protein